MVRIHPYDPILQNSLPADDRRVIDGATGKPIEPADDDCTKILQIAADAGGLVAHVADHPPPEAVVECLASGWLVHEHDAAFAGQTPRPLRIYRITDSGRVRLHRSGK